MTCHTYALDVATRAVWDYAGDNFVHRLVMGDGKLVEVDAHDESVGVDVHESSLKLEELLEQYNFLLSSQLQEQCGTFKRQQQRLHEDFGRPM